MGKVGGENKRLVTCFADRIAEAVIVAIESDKDPTGFHMTAKILTRHDIRFGTRQKFTVDIHLQVMWIRAVESIHEKGNPRGAPFEKADAQLRKSIENTIGQHRGSLGHDAEGMAERVDRIVNADGVHAEMVQRPHMYCEGHIQFLRFFVNGPVNLCAVMAFDGFAVGRQHGADHTQFYYGASELDAGSLAVLDGN